MASTLTFDLRQLLDALDDEVNWTIAVDGRKYSLGAYADLKGGRILSYYIEKFWPEVQANIRGARGQNMKDFLFEVDKYLWPKALELGLVSEKSNWNYTKARAEAQHEDSSECIVLATKASQKTVLDSRKKRGLRGASPTTFTETELEKLERWKDYFYMGDMLVACAIADCLKRQNTDTYNVREKLESEVLRRELPRPPPEEGVQSQGIPPPPAPPALAPANQVLPQPANANEGIPPPPALAPANQVLPQPANANQGIPVQGNPMISMVTYHRRMATEGHALENSLLHATLDSGAKNTDTHLKIYPGPFCHLEHGHGPTINNCLLTVKPGGWESQQKYRNKRCKAPFSYDKVCGKFFHPPCHALYHYIKWSNERTSAPGVEIEDDSGSCNTCAENLPFKKLCQAPKPSQKKGNKVGRPKTGNKQYAGQTASQEEEEEPAAGGAEEAKTN